MVSDTFDTEKDTDSLLMSYCCKESMLCLRSSLFFNAFVPCSTCLTTLNAMHPPPHNIT